MKKTKQKKKKKRKKKKKKKKVREKSRECHNHKPQPIPDPKMKRKPTNLNKHKPNKRTKSTKISSLFPKRGNRNTKRTKKHGASRGRGGWLNQLYLKHITFMRCQNERKKRKYRFGMVASKTHTRCEGGGA